MQTNNSSRPQTQIIAKQTPFNFVHVQSQLVHTPSSLSFFTLTLPQAERQHTLLSLAGGLKMESWLYSKYHLLPCLPPPSSRSHFTALPCPLAVTAPPWDIIIPCHVWIDPSTYLPHLLLVKTKPCVASMLECCRLRDRRLPGASLHARHSRSALNVILPLLG